MKKLVTIYAILFASVLSAQDSTKVLQHEIGFNTVLLIKQLISNNPNSTMQQSPYALFYNFYRDDKIGLRLGLGGYLSNDQSSVDGQATPRISKENSYSARAGVSYNFIHHGRVTLNGFADVTYDHYSSSSVNTTTTQSFPGPTIISTRTESDYHSNGIGGQVGAGVKYNLYKHLSIYVEVPVSFSNVNAKSEDTTTSNNSSTNSSTTSQSTFLRITLPTTLYLVLRF